MTDQQTLLLIEDEEAIRAGLIDVLIYHGYKVEASGNGAEGLQLALTGNYDLILLDVMLPGMDGFEVCERIRQLDREQPVIMLTAKNTDEDIVQGLKLGADDYVSKPFSVAQLVLRIQAVLRRSKTQNANQTVHLQKIQLGDESAPDLTIDTENLCGSGLVGDVSFTRREMEIIKYLASHTSRPVPREELLAQVWGYSEELEIETRTVDIHIAKIRRKIEANVKTPVNLVTIRGAGYRLKTVDLSDRAQ